MTRKTIISTHSGLSNGNAETGISLKSDKISDNDEYIYYIKLNGQILHQKENKIPRGFSEKQMKFYAANDLWAQLLRTRKFEMFDLKPKMTGQMIGSSLMDHHVETPVTRWVANVTTVAQIGFVAVLPSTVSMATAPLR